MISKINFVGLKVTIKWKGITWSSRLISLHWVIIIKCSSCNKFIDFWVGHKLETAGAFFDAPSIRWSDYWTPRKRPKTYSFCKRIYGLERRRNVQMARDGFNFRLKSSLRIVVKVLLFLPWTWLYCKILIAAGQSIFFRKGFRTIYITRCFGCDSECVGKWRFIVKLGEYKHKICVCSILMQTIFGIHYKKR